MTSPVLERYFEILQNLPAYEPRKVQERMVAEVSRVIAEKGSLVVEAGTGSGKSFGYLIPLLLQSSRPVVVSTGTIALQEQLLQKDLPFIARAAGMPDLNVKLVKGRGNYLCINKLQELEREIGTGAPERLHLNVLKAELQRGWDGDWANLDIAIPRELWDEVRSVGEDCLGRRCPYYDEQPYRRAREDLDKADIIVANHALYLQDVTATQAMLPPHEVVVFDEAHNLKHYALNAFTDRIGKYVTPKLLRKINRRLAPIPDAFLQQISETEASLLEWLFRSERNTFRLYPDDEFLALVQHHMRVLNDLQEWITHLNVKQLTLVETDLDADRASAHRTNVMQQLQGLIGRWEHFLLEDPFSRQRVNWVEVDPDRLYYELRSTPLNIAEMLRSTVWPERTAIFTSATLSASNGLNYFKNDVGAEHAEDLVLESPFRYDEQCVLYLPDHLPDPNAWDYLPALTDEVARLLAFSQGRAFVLFTSYQNMRRVSDALIPTLPFPCRVQGELPRNRLIEWFKTTRNSVLFATATFWEGIDIPGESLSCVIMDKIPFTAPDEPVNQATVEYLKAQGRDWFGEYALPQAVIKLKQGFGRLIRTGTDRGLVAILDPRMRSKGYGRKIRQSLPRVPVVSSLEALSWEGLMAVKS